MPFILQLAVSQLLSYDPVSWIAFIGIAAGAAYLGRWPGIIAGHFAVAMLIGFLDFIYQSQHSAEMDMDGVFDLGVIGRMLLINAVLLPVSAAGWFLASRYRKSARPAV
jgi:hypothetical protein